MRRGMDWHALLQTDVKRTCGQAYAHTCSVLRLQCAAAAEAEGVIEQGRTRCTLPCESVHET